MDKTVTNTIEHGNFIRRRYNNKYILCMCALFFVLIFARCFNNFFFYAFIGFSSIVFVVSNTAHCVSFLFFLLPFSTILKQSIDGMSFFTVLFFLLILKMTVSLRKINIGVFVSVGVLSFYNLAFSGLNTLTTTITMAAGILLLYYLRNEKVDFNTTVIVYSVGICLSSALAIFRSSLPIVNAFVNDSIMKLKGTEYATRFSGLNGNPNYYTLDIIVALSAIVVLMYNNKATKTHSLLFVVLSILGLMSVSKSFLLAWVALMVCWMLISIKQGFRKIIKFVVVMVVGATVAYFYAYDYINLFLYRLIKDSSGTVNSITSGRLDIWIVYIETILDNIKILILGNGLDTIVESISMGAHNTYLAAIFSMGVIGTVILVVALRNSMGKIKIKQGVWIPLLILVIRMIAIDILTYDNLWFYLATIVLLTREIANSNVTESEMVGDRK